MVSPTLTRFFVLHFVLPFLVVGLVVLHVVLLHEHGSKKPLGLIGDKDKIGFYPYYRSKDMFGFLIFFSLFMFIRLAHPNIFLCYENFMEANVLSTPEHIEPDWFLLMPYAILRSVPKKLGGVIRLLMVLVSVMVLPFLVCCAVRGKQYRLSSQFCF